jgi:hypothetical protein
MHVHASFLSFMALALQLIIFGFLWRAAAFRLADTPVGKAMAFIY